MEDDSADLLPVVTFACLVVALLLCLVIALFARPAKAHSFYSAACCSEKDCAPVSAGTVKRTAAGWETPRGGTIPFDDPRVKPTPAPHAGIHLCERPDGSIICIYVPPAGG